MPTLYNRARVNTATAGTGTMTLGSAVSNAFFTFAEAGVPDAAIVSYLIEDGSDVEMGVGTYTLSGTTLSRTVTASKISGTAGTTKLTLSGSAVVSITALAADIAVPPTTTTDHAIVRWDGTTGRAVQNSHVTIADDDSANVTFTAAGAGTDVGLVFTAKGNPARAVTYNMGAANFGEVLFRNTDDADGGPSFTLFQDSANPAADDYVANFAAKGRDSAANETIYGGFSCVIISPTNGTETSRWEFDVQPGNGTQDRRLIIHPDGVLSRNGAGVPDRRLHAEEESAATNTVTQLLRLTSTSSGTPAAGIGAGIEFEVETSASNNEVGATIEAVVTDATSTSEDFDITFKTMAAGAAAGEVVRFVGTGGILPGTNDVGALGSTAKQWADLYLAEGAVINFDNGDVTVTQSGNTLTVAGGVLSGTMAGAVSALVDGATPALDASLGNVFTLTAAGNRTIAVPSNATSGQKIVIRHLASGGARTLALNTGAGGFRFGTDITALTSTTSGKTDYIGCIYNAADSFWDVVAYSKGF
jgi:hypothetical protein